MKTITTALAAGIVAAAGLLLSTATATASTTGAQARPTSVSTSMATHQLPAPAGLAAERGTLLVRDATTPAGASQDTGPSSDIGILMQAGFDRDHWWIKISKAEVISIGIGVACRLAFPSVGWFVCPPISAAVNAALNLVPNAGGFWAELYTNGQVRVGAW